MFLNSLSEMIKFSTELRKLGQGFTWVQQWSSSIVHVQGVSSERDNNILIFVWCCSGQFN